MFRSKNDVVIVICAKHGSRVLVFEKPMWFINANPHFLVPRLNCTSRFLFADVFMAYYNSMMVIALNGP